VLQPIADRVGDDGIGNDFGPVLERQLRGEHGGLAERAFLEDFAQVLGFGRRELAHSDVVEYQHVGLGDLAAPPQGSSVAPQFFSNRANRPMDDVPPHFIYEFEGFELDARRDVLRRRSDAHALTLTPKAFGTLLYLIEHAGELIEKAALFAAVWPHVVVEAAPAAPLSRADRRWRWGKTLGAIAVVLALVAAGLAVYRGRAPHGPAADARPRSTAVLAFVDLSPAVDSAYFSDGLSEEVLNLLSQSPEMRVIARTSSFSFRDRNADIVTIARTLGVRYLLQSSVRRQGRRVRITAQIDGRALCCTLTSRAVSRASTTTEAHIDIGCMDVACVVHLVPRAPSLAESCDGAAGRAG
jgi:TolB-like protein